MWYTEAVLVCTRVIFLYAGSDSVYTEAIFLYTGCFVCSTEVIFLYTGRFYGAQGALLREQCPLSWKFLEFFCTRTSFCVVHAGKKPATRRKFTVHAIQKPCMAVRLAVHRHLISVHRKLMPAKRLFFCYNGCIFLYNGIGV